nr:hypothetical protein [Jiangella alba]
MDLADGLGVQPGAFVGEVVAGDAGDGGVAQPHGLDRLGDAAGLVAVEVVGLAGVDEAEVAAAGAVVAADEERGLAVFPALEDVGTAGLLADRGRPSRFTSDCSSRYSGPMVAFVLIQAGLLLDRRLSGATPMSNTGIQREPRRQPIHTVTQAALGG